MLPKRLPKLRFSLKSVFVLMLGIAIGCVLNIRTLQLITGLVANETFMTSLPTYTIGPPDVLEIDVSGKYPNLSPSISRQHLVGPDGRINLGEYGQLYVAGMTISEAQDAIKGAFAQHIESPQVVVNVIVYGSKVYYIVTKGQGTGDRVVRVPMTGNETVLDAIAKIGGLKAPDSTQVWIARPRLDRVGSGKILPIEWDNLVSRASTSTNYQLLPGDRVIVSRKSTSAAAN